MIRRRRPDLPDNISGGRQTEPVVALRSPAMRTRATSPWRNWAGNQRCVPVVVERPGTEDELVAIVQRAAEAGRTVKAVGAGHSFTSIACTDGTQIDLSGYQRVLHVDQVRMQVTVQAGITVAALNHALAERGMALENIGDIAYQSIAGATATATHGTGLRYRNMSSAIIGMRLVTGDGACSTAPRSTRPTSSPQHASESARWASCRMTLQCVPAFNLHAVEEAARIDDVLEQLDELVEGNDHYEMFWVPGTRWALTKRNRRTNEPARPRPTGKRFAMTRSSTTSASARSSASAFVDRTSSLGWPSAFRARVARSMSIAATRCSPASAGFASSRWSTPSRGRHSRRRSPASAARRPARRAGRLSGRMPLRRG